MGKLRQRAEQRATELLKTSDVKLDRDAGTYQLINKATKQAENLPLSGIDVGSGLFAKNRRVNRLIGKALTRNSETSTGEETPTSVQPTAPTPPKSTEGTTTPTETATKPTIAQSSMPWNSSEVKNRFSLGSTSTLVPRRLTFTPGEQFGLGFGKHEDTTEVQSTTGPVAYSGMGSVDYKPKQPFTGAGSLDYGKNSSTIIPTGTAKLVAKPTVNDADVSAYVDAMFPSSGMVSKEAFRQTKNLSTASPEILKWKVGRDKYTAESAAAKRLRDQQAARDSANIAGNRKIYKDYSGFRNSYVPY